jgi:accessory gene regulator B
LTIISISQKITGCLKSQVALSQDDEAIVNYSVQLLVTGFFNFAAIFAVAWLFGVLKLAVAAAFTAAGLRLISGGAHSESAVNCTLLGVLINVGAALVIEYRLIPVQGTGLAYVFIIIGVIAVLAVVRYAPADTPQKPITNPAQCKQLRLLSLGYLLIWTAAAVILSLKSAGLVPYFLAGSFSVVWQAFSLTPVGYKAMKVFDRVMPF